MLAVFLLGGFFGGGGLVVFECQDLVGEGCVIQGFRLVPIVSMHGCLLYSLRNQAISLFDLAYKGLSGPT